MDEVIIEINKTTGAVRVKGEGFGTKAFKRDMEDLGEVVERHVGHEHAHDHDSHHHHH